MMVSRLIVRLEGGFVQTADVFLRATNEALAEAGFSYVLNSEEFARAFGHDITKDRFLRFATSHLFPRKQTADLRTLFEVMYKRLRKIAIDLMWDQRMVAAVGAVEVVGATVRRGSESVLITRLPLPLAEKIVRDVTGGEFSDLFIRIVGEDKSGTVGAMKQAVHGAEGRVVVIETTPDGLVAAQAVEVPAVAVLGRGELDDGIFGACSVVDNLLELADGSDNAVGTQADGDQLLAGIEALLREDAALNSRERCIEMKVIDILRDKGHVVKSVNPTDTVQYLAHRLFQEKVGAMVVISQTGCVEGIVSERDLPRGLALHGQALLSMPVSNIMTRAIITCCPQDCLSRVAEIMTRRRIRHLPVSDRGQLVGLISIGDVLGSRLEEVKTEANVLRDHAEAPN